MKYLISILIFMLCACTSTQYVRTSSNGEKVEISNVSIGMNRQGVAIQFEGENRKANVNIEDSNSTEGFDKAIQLLQTAGGVKP